MVQRDRRIDAPPLVHAYDTFTKHNTENLYHGTKH